MYSLMKFNSLMTTKLLECWLYIGQHCHCWCPGANAPGHQQPQYWTSSYCTRPVSQNKYCSLKNGIKQGVHLTPMYRIQSHAICPMSWNAPVRMTQTGNYQHTAGLLHSASLVALGLSAEYENIIMRQALRIVDINLLWLVGLNIAWDYLSRNGLWANMTGGNFHHFQRSLTVPLHCPKHWQMPAVGAVRGDCERV